jgi:hypothetical protein
MNTKNHRHVKVSEQNAASASKVNIKLKFCKAMYSVYVFQYTLVLLEDGYRY